jgi:hypothetical protein
VLGVLVDLEKDEEGWVPLEVEYHPASGEMPADWEVKKRHPELASACRSIALTRGAQLAARLHMIHILDHS